jgi:SAM-dependent methyltransferase
MSPASDLVACRSCGQHGLRPFLSLGKTPLADALLTSATLAEPEPRFPLDVAFCPQCTLVQILEEVPPQQLFVDNYLYFSSFSDHLLEHSKQHAQGLIAKRALGAESLVVELASNDGYLLRNFVDAGVPVLGIDPAPDQAAAAEKAGVPTLQEFFGDELARRIRAERGPADVIIANNVMAHVPDLNGFVEGMRILIADDGVITVENPYVRDLVQHCEFDTIYHEHFCYFSCTAVDRLMRRHGLFLNDVEYFPDLHGGTLRWHIGARENVSETARRYLAEEQAAGMTQYGYYADFAERVEQVRNGLLSLLQGLKSDGARIAGYGAAAKGSTLLNFVGIDGDLLDYVVDRNVHKQGCFMPGVHLPIRDPGVLVEDRPDYLLLLAWNFADEIRRQQQEYSALGGKFIVPVPTPVVV